MPSTRVFWPMLGMASLIVDDLLVGCGGWRMERPGTSTVEPQVAHECDSSLNAETFYRALGFKRIRELDIELQPRVVFRAVLMRRELQGR